MRRRREGVVHVVAQYPPVYGGAGGQAAALSKVLVTRGWRVVTVTLDQEDVGSELSNEVGRIRRMACPRDKGRGATARRSLILGVAGAWTVFRERPRVVHIHGAYWWSVPAAWVGRLMGATVVVKITRDGEDDPATCQAKRSRGMPVGWLYASSFRAAHHVVALNALSEDSCRRAGLAAKTRRMTNGVDETRFVRSDESRARARESLGLLDDTRAALFVGYLVKHKGVLDLLDAWVRITRPGLRLFLVGPMEGFYRELDDDTVSRVRSAEARDDSVTLAGTQTGERLLDYYRAADCFVLPSYQEGMPNSLLEALVMGLPVVGGDIPGIQELAREQLLLVEPGDVSGLSKALEVTLARPSEPAPASQDLWLSSVTDAYERIYDGRS